MATRTISSIKDLYDYIGLKRVPVHKDFDILTHQDTYPDTHKMVAAHRRGFYSMIFIEHQQDGEMLINQLHHAGEKNLLFFQSPEHIFSFVRGDAMKGFLVFFKPEFLLPLQKDLTTSYPYFGVNHNNVLHLNTSEKQEFTNIFKLLIAESTNSVVSKHLIMVLLEKAKHLFSSPQNPQQIAPKKEQLLGHFKRLVNQHFIEEKSVQFYAKQLYLTPNHLNEKIRLYTGKNAKAFITERVILEAKNMLRYTTLDIAEISHTLNFTEPSYFGKYFKKHTHYAPKDFRQQF